MGTKFINSGIADSAIILTAEKMGYNPGYVDIAKRAITDGGDMESFLIGNFSKEAVIMHNLIAKDNRFDESNIIAQEILSEYGY